MARKQLWSYDVLGKRVSGLVELSHVGQVWSRLLLALLIVGISFFTTACDLPQVSAEERLFLPLSLDFLSAYTLPKQDFRGTRVGGLSAIAYDRQRSQFYALSDDRGEFAPARFYTLKLALEGANPALPHIKQVDITRVTTLTDQTGAPYANGTIDPEGIALSPLGTIFVASEGVARQGVAPFIHEFALNTGQWKRSLTIPPRYLPNLEEGQPIRGVGNNLGFESLTLNMTGGSTVAIEPFRLFTATESALVQDVDTDHPQQGASRNRVLHYSIDPTRSLLVSEHLYAMEPPPAGALYHGLVELLAIDQGGHFISLERSFGANGFTAKLFQLSMGGATDTSMIDSFKGSLSAQPIRKKLLLDLTQLGIRLDNLEGLAFGPQLPDGSRSLVLISDDNFQAEQITQFLLFRFRANR